MTMREHLVAEIASVRSILAMIPAEQVIDRLSFEGRAASLQEKLDGLRDEPTPPQVRLYFDGSPVIGSRAIEAEFACNAIRSFSSAVQARAADLRGQLKPDGPWAGKKRHELFFTQKLAGSFGFELTAMRPGLGDADLENLTEAIDSVGNVIDGSLHGDAELAEAIETTQPRVLSLVRVFLDRCVKAQAVFRFASHTRKVEPKGITEIAQAAQRLAHTKTENEVDRRGVLIGVFTDSREFEFEESGPERTVYRGRISKALDKDAVRALAQHLFKVGVARFRVTRVGTSMRGVRRLLLSLVPASD